MNLNKSQNALFIRLTQPLLLAGLILTYSIGVGLSHYLGASLDWTDIFFGAFLGIFFVLMRNLLAAYFDHPSSPTSKIHAEDPRYEELNSVNRQTLLLVALTVLTAGALDTVILVVRHAVNFSAILLLGIAFLFCFFSSVPPVQFEKKGYGELSEAILIANLVPAIGFLLSEPNLHVLLVMLTFPLTLLYLALRIVFSLTTYAFDRTHSKQTLIVRMDWQKAMNSHNYLILAAFLFVALFSLIGQPWSLTWPMLLPLVFGIFQIIQIQGIVAGAAPKWNLLKWTAAGTFTLTAYLVSFTLWIG
ncbi:MAG: hypothetical protein FD147_405 [Chloroflexi bacterium]|nr:MAG: hypothetical protein FD147_405 [Chloroflexota bacterium]MBA4376691.1 hypothetical protein [Anaerolinea sp.]